MQDLVFNSGRPRWGATKAMMEGRLGIPAQRKILLSF